MVSYSLYTEDLGGVMGRMKEALVCHKWEDPNRKENNEGRS